MLTSEKNCFEEGKNSKQPSPIERAAGRSSSFVVVVFLVRSLQIGLQLIREMMMSASHFVVVSVCLGAEWYMQHLFNNVPGKHRAL